MSLMSANTAAGFAVLAASTTADLAVLATTFAGFLYNRATEVRVHQVLIVPLRVQEGLTFFSRAKNHAWRINGRNTTALSTHITTTASATCHTILTYKFRQLRKGLV